MRLCGIPMPVSRTARRRWCAPGLAGSASTCTTTSPRSVNFTAFDRGSAAPDAASRSRRRPPAVRRPRQGSRARSPSPRPAGRRCRARSRALAEVERRLLEVEPAGLDLRVVEDVVDHVEQRVTARPDDLGELALLVRQLGAEEQVRHPDHAVHRRPDLVAHRRQEGALRLRRRLGLLPGGLELADVRAVSMAVAA